MSNEEQKNAIEQETFAMLQILQQIHDEASIAMFGRKIGHESLQDALDTIKDLAESDWSYTP